MSLLNPSIEDYVFEKKTWKGDVIRIFNLQGKKVGMIKRKTIPMRDKVRLLNNDESEVCTIDKKLVGAHSIYDVKSPDGSLIGRCKGSMMGFRDSVDMYDLDNNMIYRVQSNPTRGVLRIIDAKNQERILAEITRDKKMKAISKPSFNFNNHSVIHIVDLTASRMSLFAYAIIVDNVEYDK